MFRYITGSYDLISEMEESLNYYTTEDMNAIYEFIKKNENNPGKIVYNKNTNTLETI